MIRPATAADLPAVVAIYNAIFDQEERSGIVYTHWERSSYPTPDTARTAFEAGTLFVGETDGVIWGSMNLNGIQLPEYKKINWSIPAADSEVAVIHTLTIDPAKAGHGLAHDMVAFAEAQSRKNGKKVIRLDTWEHNAPANHLYPSMDYRFAGATDFFFMGYVYEILNLYEKAL